MSIWIQCRVVRREKGLQDTATDQQLPWKSFGVPSREEDHFWGSLQVMFVPLVWLWHRCQALCP